MAVGFLLAIVENRSGRLGRLGRERDDCVVEPSFCSAEVGRRALRRELRGWRRLANVAWYWPVVLLLACGGNADRIEPPRPTVDPDIARYLLSPWVGFPFTVEPAVRAEVDAGFEALRTRGQTEVARETSRRLLQIDPNLMPADVLRAQADFVEGRHEDVVRAMGAKGVLELWRDSQPAVDGLPLLREDVGEAGQLILARSSERLGRADIAYAGYLAAPSVDVARDGVARTRQAALETVAGQLADWVSGGRLDAADRALERLREWGPESRLTLRSALDIALAREDPRAELAALRDWVGEEGTVGTYKRLAHLEVEYGSAERGLEIFTQLSERFPNDPEVADGLASAQFVWRLDMLPESVHRIVTQETLSRAEFAELLFWLLPGVRSGRAESAQIVTDLALEHPHREAVVRVVNLGLMPLRDVTLRQFQPDRELTRLEGLRVLLSLPRRFGKEASCTRDLPEARATEGAVCETATRCRLVAVGDDCSPQIPMSGRAAREGLRRMLTLLEDTR